MMAGRFIVVGVGNVGLRVLWDLASRGHEVVGLDSSYDSVERAREMGLEAEVGDASAVQMLAKRLGGVDAVLTALPGAIGYKVVERLVDQGFNVVDVSFFPEDPWPLMERAVRNNVTVVVDAGIAPGLSNFLVGAGVRRIGARRARIFVGGVSSEPTDPLGLSATWSTEDLIDEYLRPARYIDMGSVRSVLPLEYTPGEINIPGVGMMEYFPTDGLRTLLRTYSGMEFMAEYTLRWPGHLRVIKALADVGLLDSKRISVEGCPITPRSCLASILRYRFRGVRDLVVLLVELEGDGGVVKYRSIVEADENWSAMAKATGSFQATIAELLYRGMLPPGLVVPEQIGSDRVLADMVGDGLTGRGVQVLED